MSKIIGIDLGTTNSVVAVMQGGEPTVIPNQEGARTTPSVVAITKSGERLVGQVAKRQAITNPENTVYSIKRFMGRRFDEVTEEAKRVPYKVVKGPNDDVRIDISGKVYTPPEISAMILQKLKTAAEDFLGEKVTEGGHYRPGIFQRQPAAGDETSRRDCGHGSGADHQRADGRSARVRLGQEEGRDDRRVRPGWRNVRHFDSGSGRRRGGSEVDERGYAPGRRRH